MRRARIMSLGYCQTAAGSNAGLHHTQQILEQQRPACRCRPVMRRRMPRHFVEIKIQARQQRRVGVFIDIVFQHRGIKHSSGCLLDGLPPRASGKLMNVAPLGTQTGHPA